MTHYHGPLGKVFGGTCEDLRFLPFRTHYPQSVNPTIVNTTAVTMKASVVEATYISSSKQEKEFLDFFKEEMTRDEFSP